MTRTGALCLITGILLIYTPIWASNEIKYSFTIEFEREDVNLAGENASLVGGNMLGKAGEPELGYKHAKFVLPPGVRLRGITYQVPDTVILANDIMISRAAGDIRLGDYHGAPGPPSMQSDGSKYYPEARARVSNSGYWGDLHVADLDIYPLAYREASGTLVFFPRVEIVFHLVQSGNAARLRPDPIAYQTLSESAINRRDFESLLAYHGDGTAGTLSAHAEYLIVTSDSLMAAFEPYRAWKNQKGISAEIVGMGEILASSSGRDDAERLRNYLINAYQDASRWVLLGGDEDNVPIRYAFAADTNGAFNNRAAFQICDLYFADLTGDWDSDGDGVWGELHQDDADIYPELYVGRIPVRNSRQVSSWVNKALTYEKDPGRGDRSYLTKALIICADEMRNLNQHITLAELLPGNFATDNSRLIEEPDGRSDFPTGPTGIDIIDVMGEGWGFISNHNHGDYYNYTAMSNGYNISGRSLLWGDTVITPTDAAISHLADIGKPGVQFSLSCYVAAFDFDKDIFYPGPYLTTYALVESAIGEPGGQVAFMGFTRWSWVLSSFRLEQRLINRLFADSTNQLGVAEALCKTDNPDFMDLVYGHNLFGDPETRMWLSVDGVLHVAGPERIEGPGARTLEYIVTSDGAPVRSASVCLYMDRQIVAITETDGGGMARFEYEPISSGELIATATRPRYLPGQDTAVVAAPTGVDDKLLLPAQSEMGQNYPNPFNSSTAIEFNLSKSGRARLEVFDIAGRRVAMLADGLLLAGRNRVIWAAGEDYSSGLYFYRLSAEDVTVTKQMMLIR